MLSTDTKQARLNARRAQSQGRARSGELWTQREDELLLSQTRPTDDVLAAQLRRSEEAVELRRVLLQVRGNGGRQTSAATAGEEIETPEEIARRIDPERAALLYGEEI